MKKLVAAAPCLMNVTGSRAPMKLLSLMSRSQRSSSFDTREQITSKDGPARGIFWSALTNGAYMKMGSRDSKDPVPPEYVTGPNGVGYTESSGAISGEPCWQKM